MRNHAFLLMVAICHARIDVRRAHGGTKQLDGFHEEILASLKPAEKESWKKTELPDEVLGIEIDEVENRIMSGYK